MAIPVQRAESPELDGKEMLKDVKALVDISYASRAAGDRLWGRLAGGPWARKAVDHVESQFRKAGLTEIVRAEAPFLKPEYIPTTWMLSLEGTGPGASSPRVTLQSAIPMGVRIGPDQRTATLPATNIRSVTAPLVYVGANTAADRAGLDLKGKIAVIRIEPSTVLFHSPAPRQVGELITAGAVGVIMVYDTPGNMQVEFGACATAPCFTVGGEDGGFLNAVIAKSKVAGATDQIRATLSATYELRRGPAEILFAKIKGRSSAGNIIVSAHSDAWFSGANDNGTGVAGLIALAKHYAKGPRPAHDMYFVLSPGHHSPTDALHRFVELVPDAGPKNVFMINLEHIAQRGMTRDYMNEKGMGSRISKYGEPYAGWIPINAESPGREFLGGPLTPTVRRILGEAARRNQFIAPTRVFEGHLGEMHAIGEAGATTFQTVDASLWYHTSGDALSTIPPEALQRSVAFFKEVIDQMLKLSRPEVREGAN